MTKPNAHRQTHEHSRNTPPEGIEYRLLLNSLVVEDDAQVIDSIILCLRLRWPGVRMIATASGLDALRFVRSSVPDIILLDLTLADLYGLQVLREIRNASDVPVIIITANNEEVFRLRSFEMGTTDYILKPFSHLDLLGSVSASLRRRTAPLRPEDDFPRIGPGLIIDLVGRRLLREGVEISLSPIQWKVLGLLLQNHGQTTPYLELAKTGWETDRIDRSILNGCLYQLQLKLGDNPDEPKFLTPDPAGYCLSVFSARRSASRPGTGI